jgi:hypothetical protein
MTATYYLFEDMLVGIDRPIELRKQDSAIGIRCYERLKELNVTDKWTQETDALIEKHKIKFWKATKEEFAEYYKKGTDVTIRL